MPCVSLSVTLEVCLFTRVYFLISGRKSVNVNGRLRGCGDDCRRMLANLVPEVAAQHIVTFFGGLQRKDVRFWKTEPTVLPGAFGRDGRRLFCGSFYYKDFHSGGSPYELKC